MFGLGIWEIALLCIALLVFVRPEELPKVMGKLGQWYGRVTGSSRYLMRRLQEPFELDDEQAGGDEPEGSGNSSLQAHVGAAAGQCPVRRTGTKPRRRERAEMIQGSRVDHIGGVVWLCSAPRRFALLALMDAPRRRREGRTTAPPAEQRDGEECLPRTTEERPTA